MPMDGSFEFLVAGSAIFFLFFWSRTTEKDNHARWWVGFLCGTIALLGAFGIFLTSKNWTIPKFQPQIETSQPVENP